MKEFMVSLNIITNSLVNNDDMLNELGIPKMDIDKRESTDSIMWIIESMHDKSMSILEHIIYLSSLFDDDKIIIPNQVIKDIYLIIGVVYDTATCTVAFSSEMLRTTFCTPSSISMYTEQVLCSTCAPWPCSGTSTPTLQGVVMMVCVLCLSRSLMDFSITPIGYRTCWLLPPFGVGDADHKIR